MAYNTVLDLALRWILNNLKIYNMSNTTKQTESQKHILYKSGDEIAFKIKYEKFRASVWNGDELIQGFSCYLTEHAHQLAEDFVNFLILKRALADN